MFTRDINFYKKKTSYQEDEDQQSLKLMSSIKTKGDKFYKVV